MISQGKVDEIHSRLFYESTQGEYYENVDVRLNGKEVFGWNDLREAHMKMLRNEHKPGNMSVLVQAPQTGLRTLEDALEAKL